jgi:hypothetical protein
MLSSFPGCPLLAVLSCPGPPPSSCWTGSTEAARKPTQHLRTLVLYIGSLLIITVCACWLNKYYLGTYSLSLLGWRDLADNSGQPVQTWPVLIVLSQLSCPGEHALAVLSRLSWVVASFLWLCKDSRSSFTSVEDTEEINYLPNTNINQYSKTKNNKHCY